MRAMTKLLATCFMIGLASTAQAAPFKLTSADFKEGGSMKDKNTLNTFGCSGGNESPALEWANPPAGTKSFAILVHDPDAPTGGSGFWHWVVYNIPADTKSLAAGAGKADGSALPKGATQGNTDLGSPGYAGPCPPPGTPHHYNFTIYALKVDKLDVPANATAAIVGFTINANMLGKAKLTGMYGRKK